LIVVSNDELAYIVRNSRTERESVEQRKGRERERERERERRGDRKNEPGEHKLKKRAKEADRKSLPAIRRSAEASRKYLIRAKREDRNDGDDRSSQSNG
jgi:hypothetical protein